MKKTQQIASENQIKDDIDDLTKLDNDVRFGPQQDLLSQQYNPSFSYSQFLQHRSISIEGPDLITEGLLKSYKLYKIKTTKKNQKDTEVRRRYSDFAYLHHCLTDQYGGCILPKLPQKSIFTMINLQSASFKQQRIKGLQKYLHLLISHTVLRKSLQLRSFLFDNQQQHKFAQSKGDFTLKSSTMQSLKQYIVSYFPKGPSKEDLSLLQYERKVQDLMRTSNHVRKIVMNTHKEVVLISQLIPKEVKVSLSNFISQYDQLHEFIECCVAAICRMKKLKNDINYMEEKYEVMTVKMQNNPRSQEMDMLQSQLNRSKEKAVRWSKLLFHQLNTHTQQGRSKIQTFIAKFTQIKRNIYIK